MHPDDRERLHGACRAAVATVDSVSCEFRFRRPDGEERWIALRGRAIASHDGRPIALLGTAVDVTERRRADDVRAEGDLKLRLVLEQLPATVWTTDSELRITSMSHRTGLPQGAPSREDMIGRTLYELGDPRRESVLAHERALRGETVRYRLDYLGMTFDARVEPLRDETGSAAGVVGIAHDVTELADAQRRLAASEARYRQLVENAVDVIAATDLEGRLTDVNAAASDLLGFTREELLELGVDVVVPEHRALVLASIRAKLEGARDAVVYEVDYRTKDGGRVPVEVSSRIVYAQGEPAGVQLVARDLRPRRAFEEQVRMAQRLDAVGHLAGGVAHEFNNLLTAILGQTDLLLRRLPAAEREEAQAVQRAAERAARLTRQLLAFAGRQTLRPAVLDVNEVVLSLERLLRPLLRPHVQLVLDLQPEPAEARADRAELEQALLDLALAARERGDPLLLAISVREVELDAAAAAAAGGALPTGRYVRVSLSDTGRGLDERARATLFEPFARSQAAGTGLELASAFGTVRQSGGDIVVTSEPGRGTTLDLYLPHAARAHQAQGGATVLLVEDDELVRRLMREILEDRGYRVLAASSGAEALALAGDGPIDLLLTDIVMPGMSGRELAARLRAERPALRVLYTSGYPQELPAAAGDEGLDAVAKPFSAAELAERVRAALDRPPS